MSTDRDPFAYLPPPPLIPLGPALARAVLRCLGRKRRLSPGAPLGLPRVLEEMAADLLGALLVEGSLPGWGEVKERWKEAKRAVGRARRLRSSS